MKDAFICSQLPSRNQRLMSGSVVKLGVVDAWNGFKESELFGFGMVVIFLLMRKWSR